jgi:hypothetical protein
LLVVVAAAVILRAALLDSFSLSPDEGIHLMWLRLLSAGYQPLRGLISRPASRSH